MIRILFVCHGNICRSPMAEMIFGQLLRENELDDVVECSSAATSEEEIGKPIYPAARLELERHGILVKKRAARRIAWSDYENYYRLVAMDDANARDARRLMGGDPKRKICRLMDFTERGGSVDDPWYTGCFDVAYQDIREGCEGLLKKLISQGL